MGVGGKQQSFDSGMVAACAQALVLSTETRRLAWLFVRGETGAAPTSLPQYLAVSRCSCQDRVRAAPTRSRADPMGRSIVIRDDHMSLTGTWNIGIATP